MQGQDGARAGEMEVGCLAAHGAAGLLPSMLSRQADAVDIPMCGACGTATVAEGGRICSKCKRSTGLYRVPMPYVSHVMDIESTTFGGQFCWDIEPAAPPAVVVRSASK